MSPGRLVIRAGGEPAPAQLAALTAALTALLEGAAIARAVQPWSRR